MGREVRMVPPEWEHPKKHGQYVPLLAGYSHAVQERVKFRERDDLTYTEEDLTYTEEDYFGSAEVDPSEYMPEWAADVATHYRMYETCSEGTPISPPFATPEELARWLANTNASAFGNMGASYEGWLATIKRTVGAVGLIVTIGPDGNTITPAVEAMASAKGSGRR